MTMFIVFICDPLISISTKDTYFFLEILKHLLQNFIKKRKKRFLSTDNGLMNYEQMIEPVIKISLTKNNIMRI